MGLSEDLAGVPEPEYGDNHSEHRLEMYKLYVEMADRVSQRRQAANSFYLALNTAIVALISYVQIGSSRLGEPVFHAAVSLAGVAICYLWYRLIRSYRDLNSGKFRVVHELEACLPVRPYDAEWTALGRGVRPDLYLPFTHIETRVPWVFACIHCIVLIGLAYRFLNECAA